MVYLIHYTHHITVCDCETYRNYVSIYKSMVSILYSFSLFGLKKIKDTLGFVTFGYFLHDSPTIYTKYIMHCWWANLSNNHITNIAFHFGILFKLRKVLNVNDVLNNAYKQKKTLITEYFATTRKQLLYHISVLT